MATERTFRTDVDLDPSPAARTSFAPGRSTVTSRHVMRRARDEQGVAPDADARVERAATSQGAPLPAELRGRFESSLGADLSGVRVHTGDVSADAAHAVGAKAYAVGRDIHFGAGHYDPSSSAGQVLIAHEVAHTVQQGSGPARRQAKLAVSSSGDAAELEADRAAEAMVAGHRAALSPGGGATLHRDELDGCPTDQPCMTTNDPAVASQAMANPNTTIDDPRVHAQNNPRADECVAFHPDPSDPYTKPPFDWSATAPVASTNSKAPYEPKDGFANPKGPLDNSGHNVDASQAQIGDAVTAQDAFRAAMAQLAATTQSAYPRETEWMNAGKEIDGDPELRKMLGWTNPGGDNLSAVALGQESNGVKMADVFRAGPDAPVGTEANVDLSKANDTQAAKDAKLDVNGKLSALETANGNYLALVRQCHASARNVGNKIAALQIEKLGTEVADAEGELQKATNERHEAIEAIKESTEAIEASLKLVEGVTNLAHHPDHTVFNVAEAGVKLSSIARTRAATEGLTEKINTLSGKVGSGKQRIAACKVKLANDEVDTAKASFDALRGQVDVAKQAVVDAANAVQVAYDKFGDAAGSAAGGSDENQKRVSAAVRAIPKVEKVVADTTMLVNACEVPAFTADGGRGYNAAFGRSAFLLHVGWVKGLRQKYGKEAGTWQQRLQSLQGIAGSFGNGGTSEPG
jgi:hypothetical protein